MEFFENQSFALDCGRRLGELSEVGMEKVKSGEVFCWEMFLFAILVVCYFFFRFFLFSFF